MAEAKSYAERLFDYRNVGPLEPDYARDALILPAKSVGATYTDEAVEAVEAILVQTQRYPYFLQEWGQQAWAQATQSPFTNDNVTAATDVALAKLDESFFRVRFERLTPLEKRYMRAMAELGPGPRRSGDVSDKLQRPTRQLGSCRAGLIQKGVMFQ